MSRMISRPQPGDEPHRGVLTAHDADRFDIYLIDATPPEKGRVQQSEPLRHDHPDPGPRRDRRRARISNAGIDILVDLKGYTGGARPGIFNQLAAPITGLLARLPRHARQSRHRFISSAIASCCRTAQAALYREVLPHAGKLHAERPGSPAAARNRARARDLALPESKFVFSAFTPPDKISPEVFGLWISIMKKVPDSVLWMAETSTLARQNLTRFALLQGVMPNRLIFAPNASYEDHLARIQAADLALDTSPITGSWKAPI